MKRAYKTELKVTEEQKTKIRKTIGTCRVVYNLYLDTQKTFYKETGKFMSGYDFSKLNDIELKFQLWDGYN